MEWIQAIAAVASGLAAVLAWVAKIRWSNEFAAAKDEVIRAKESQLGVKDEKIQYLERQIDWLSKFNPKAIDDHYSFAVTKLEEINGALNGQVTALQGEVTDKELEISRLREAGEAHSARIQQLSSEIETLKSKRNSYQHQANYFGELARGTAVISDSVKDAVVGLGPDFMDIIEIEPDYQVVTPGIGHRFFQLQGQSKPNSEETGKKAETEEEG